MKAVGPEKTILATFGVSDEAVMGVLTGHQFKPSGKLPFALARNAEVIVKQDPDAPGYEEEDTLFPVWARYELLIA